MKKYIVWILIVVLAVGGFFLKKTVDDHDRQQRISDSQKQQAIHELELQMFSIRQEIAARKVSDTYVPATTAASVALFVYQPEDIAILNEIADTYQVETAAAVMVESLSDDQYTALLNALKEETCEVALFCFARTDETEAMLQSAREVLGSRCTVIGVRLADSQDPAFLDDLLQKGFTGVLHNLNTANYEATENGTSVWNYCVASSTYSFKENRLGTIMKDHLPATFLLYFNGAAIDLSVIDTNMQQLLAYGDEISFLSLSGVTDAVRAHAATRATWSEDLSTYVARQEARLAELQAQIDSYSNR